jgi:hypothetical protein
VADRLEAALRDLTSPGYRVYPPSENRTRFWRRMTED